MDLALGPDDLREQEGVAAVRAAEVQADVARLHDFLHVGGFRLPFPVLHVALVDAHRGGEVAEAFEGHAGQDGDSRSAQRPVQSLSCGQK